MDLRAPEFRGGVSRARGEHSTCRESRELALEQAETPPMSGLINAGTVIR